MRKWATPKEVEALRAIATFAAPSGPGTMYCPSIAIVQRAIGLKSLNGAWKRIVSLERKGYVLRDGQGITITGRGRRVLDWPETFRRTVIEYLVRLEMSQYESLITEVNKRKFQDAKHRDGNGLDPGSGEIANPNRPAHDR